VIFVVFVILVNHAVDRRQPYNPFSPSQRPRFMYILLPMDESEPKRDTERIPVPSLHGEVKVYQPMTILDISLGGAQVETPFPLQVDSLHDFRLSLGERSIVVKGRIAHSHIGELREGVPLYRTGVEFIEPSEHVQTAIDNFVAALRAARDRPPIVDAELAE
jgi:hypothetical protein